MPTLDLQVGASSDDCRAYWNGSAWGFGTTPHGQPVGYYGSGAYKQGGGMRFLGATIPNGATILTAYLTFQALNSQSLTVVNSRIKGEDADNPSTFSDYANYDGRERTSAVVDWDAIPAWTEDADYNSPEIKAIIQEIVNRVGWASGNAVVIFWVDHDNRTTNTDETIRFGKTYDASPANATKLHVEYAPLVVVGRSYGYIIG